MTTLTLALNNKKKIINRKLTELTLNPTKDCFVNIWEPDTVYNYNNIQIYNGGVADSMYGLLYFDLTDILGKNITKAELNLYADSLAVYTVLGIKIITSSWYEAIVTWNTKPSIGSAIYYQESIPIGSGWKTFNILDLVSAVADGAAYDGIWIFVGNDPNDYCWCQFSSKEGTNIPSLLIEYW